MGVTPLNNIDSKFANTRDVFPLIQVGEQFQIEFALAEPEGVGLGLGFIPFLLYVGKEGNGLTEIPDFRSIKTAIANNFNNTHLIKMTKEVQHMAYSLHPGQLGHPRPQVLMAHLQPEGYNGG